MIARVLAHKAGSATADSRPDRLGPESALVPGGVIANLRHVVMLFRLFCDRLHKAWPDGPGRAAISPLRRQAASSATLASAIIFAIITQAYWRRRLREGRPATVCPPCDDPGDSCRLGGATGWGALAPDDEFAIRCYPAREHEPSRLGGRTFVSFRECDARHSGVAGAGWRSHFGRASSVRVRGAMVRDAYSAGGQPQQAEGGAAVQTLDLRGSTANLTQELSQLLAASIAQGQAGKRAPGAAAAGSELANLRLSSPPPRASATCSHPSGTACPPCRTPVRRSTRRRRRLLRCRLSAPCARRPPRQRAARRGADADPVDVAPAHAERRRPLVPPTARRRRPGPRRWSDCRGARRAVAERLARRTADQDGGPTPVDVRARPRQGRGGQSSVKVHVAAASVEPRISARTGPPVAPQSAARSPGHPRRDRSLSSPWRRPATAEGGAGAIARRGIAGAGQAPDRERGYHRSARHSSGDRGGPPPVL